MKFFIKGVKDGEMATGKAIMRGDVSDGRMKPGAVAMVDEVGGDTPGIGEGQRGFCTNALFLEGAVVAFDLAVALRVMRRAKDMGGLPEADELPEPRGFPPPRLMMLDADVAAVAPSTTYRVLKAAGFIWRAHSAPSKKGTGFVQPLVPHEHWHVDFSYLNIGGIFYFLCAVLDGCSRSIVAWDIQPTMRKIDSEIVLQKAREAYPKARPRVITDQGSQFKSREFKSFLSQWQASHVLTSPYYPQSNGKLERFHQTLKKHAIRPLTPLDLADAKRITGDFINYYNSTRLHSAIGFIARFDRLNARHQAIHAARDKKLENARLRRKIARSTPQKPKTNTKPFRS